MKLLFDENLSPRLVSYLTTTFPGSLHVRDVGLARADDNSIWSYAREYGFAIVSKDSDFHQRSLISGPLPKVIWIQRGNCSTMDIIEIFKGHHSVLEEFEKNSEAAFLALG